MNRRTFLATAGLAAQASHVQNAIINVPDQRVYSLNRNWLFLPKAAPGAEAAAFNDSAFQRVTLPHSNIELPWHSFDDAAYEFVSAYRRHFRVPESWRGKRVFVDFAGAMTASKVFINGHSFEEYRGGYTPFSFELTPHLNFGGVNLLAVILDSTERADIPPFGRSIDYLTFGGIYRDVQLRVVPTTHIVNIFAKPMRVLGSDRALIVRCYLDGPITRPITLSVELRDGAHLIKRTSVDVNQAAAFHEVTLDDLDDVQLWDLSRPKLYDVIAHLSNADAYSTRIGFREAKFTEKGFFLNGQQIKLRRPEPPPNLSLCRRCHARPCAGPRRPHPSQGAKGQYRP